MAKYIAQAEGFEEPEKKPNPFYVMSEAISKSAEEALRETCKLACENMRVKLMQDGHVKSGELVDSIDYTLMHYNNKVTAYIKMNHYGKFIDEGTGAAHGVQGGREGYWRYKDKDGNWHTTNGMDADPFIDVSLEKALLSLPETLFKELEKANEELEARKAGGNS